MLEPKVSRFLSIFWPVLFQPQQHQDDIITVDNVYQYVEKPKGPDSFTINVESALNFSG